jgi:hypothetical protein
MDPDEIVVDRARGDADFATGFHVVDQCGWREFERVHLADWQLPQMVQRCGLISLPFCVLHMVDGML